KLVLTEAIKDSRRKAELIAETLGQKITGLEEADFEYAEEIQLMRSAPMLKANSCDSLASQLNNPVQTISKNISMVWISEEK
ncbi:MAG: SIMPL domain-containing protein, partial [Ruminococcus sp.]|nr:SIMPL domain-containing protein [Ruminococcus sp.]